MADSQTPSTPSSPDDMHWGFSFLREDLQDVKQEMRDFRKDMADQISGLSKDVAGQFKDVRSEIRHSMIISMGYTTILLGLLAAFLQYRLPPG